MRPVLYLASASPRRTELLTQIGIPHLVLRVPAPEGEDEPRHIDESPLVYVQRTALDKAKQAATWIAQPEQRTYRDRIAGYPILAADTTVCLGDQIFGKPIDDNDAFTILSTLSDKTHLVYTAVVLKTLTGVYTALSSSEVSFKKLTPDDIRQYIKTGEPFGKAGAYGIQGYAARLIKNLNGSYSGVMGLPIFETSEMIIKSNISII